MLIRTIIFVEVAVGSSAGIALQSVDWSEIGKIWGPLGVFSVVFLVLLIGGAKAARTLLTETLADSRKERDRMAMVVEKQREEYLAASRYRDDLFRDESKKIIEALDRVGRKK